MPLAAVDAAVIEPLDAGEDFEQRGFAGSVGADDADALFWRDEPVQVFKEDSGAEAFPGACQLNHEWLAVRPILPLSRSDYNKQAMKSSILLFATASSMVCFAQQTPPVKTPDAPLQTLGSQQGANAATPYDRNCRRGLRREPPTASPISLAIGRRTPSAKTSI